MSEVSITLQPFEEDNFITGYPGIPPCTGRTHASLRGVAAVRIGPDVLDKASAKWVRIELQKVETILHKGVKRSFEERVGPHPTTLWSSCDVRGEGYGLLVTQDLPFNITIPETVPPSFEREDGVGIRYQLVASACLKGKGGILRRRKPLILNTISPVTIQKHELHSTWPAYSVSERREVVQDGYKLTVQSNQRCFGPGDRISVTATLESSKTTALRTSTVPQEFEIQLKDAITFKSTSDGGASPFQKESTISRNTIPINLNANDDTSTPHSDELTCEVPYHYNMPSLHHISSRHINIMHTLCVKATLSNVSISIDLPVMISNITRHVSAQLVDKIGAVSSLGMPSTKMQPLSPPPSSLVIQRSACHHPKCPSSQYGEILADQSSQMHIVPFPGPHIQAVTSPAVKRSTKAINPPPTNYSDSEDGKFDQWEAAHGVEIQPPSYTLLADTVSIPRDSTHEHTPDTAPTFILDPTVGGYIHSQKKHPQHNPTHGNHGKIKVKDIVRLTKPPGPRSKISLADSHTGEQTARRAKRLTSTPTDIKFITETRPTHPIVDFDVGTNTGRGGTSPPIPECSLLEDELADSDDEGSDHSWGRMIEMWDLGVITRGYY